MRGRSKGWLLSWAAAVVTLSAGLQGAAAQALTPESFVDAEFNASRTLQLIRAQYAYAMGYTGEGVTIAVVDSGLDVNHAEFSGRVSPFLWNYEPGYADSDVYSDLTQDGRQHGTHVAGLAAAGRNGFGTQGVAYRATVLPFRTDFDDEAVDRAFLRAIEGGAKVLNGSFGPGVVSPLYLKDPNVPGKYIRNPDHRVLGFQAVTPGIDDSYDQVKEGAAGDIVMVFANGNEREDQPGPYTLIPTGYGMLPLITPANSGLAGHGGMYRFIDGEGSSGITNPDLVHYLDERDPSDPDRQEVESADFSDSKGMFITVAATDPNGVIAPYSNLCGAAAAWCMSAPGGSDEQPVYAPIPYGVYGPMQGTSMAAPVVAGAAAVVRQAFPYMTARQIIEVVLTTANRDGAWADHATYGRGMLDLGKAVHGPVLFGAPLGGSPFENIFAPSFRVDTRGHDSTWSNDIDGTGGMAKAGAGTLTMKGMNSYRGATDISGGKLVVDGSIASSALLTVGSDAALGGSGTVGKTDMYGHITPGNSVGTLTVAGDYTQHPGSVFELELGPDASMDKLVVSGTADIRGGTIQVHGLKAQHVNRQFPFLEAGNWGAQAFGSNNIALPFIDVTTAYSATNAALSVQRNATSFASVAQTRNQRSVAQAVDSQGPGAATFDEIVMLEHVAPAPALFETLSGEIYASTQSALFDTGNVLRQTALSRTRQAAQASGTGSSFGSGQPVGAPAAMGSAAASVPRTLPGGRHAVWGQALGSWGQLGSSDDAGKLDRSLGGLMFGGDTALNSSTRAGVALGYTASTFTSGASSRVRADGYHLMAYLGSQQGRWALRAGLTQSWYDVDTRRRLAHADWGTAESSASAQSTQLFAEAGYGLQTGMFTVEPYAGIAQVWLRQAGFTEDGSPVGLRADSARNAVTFSTLGVRGGLTLEQGRYGAALATVGLGWRHALGDVDATRRLGFATGDAYRVAGAPLARNAMVAEAGIDWAAGQNSRVSLSYAGQIAGSTQDHGVRARISWAF